MSLRNKLLDAIAGRVKNVAYQESSNRIHVSALCSAYENLFAQVRPVVNKLKEVVPYAVNESGVVLNLRKAPELEALMATPNEKMSYLDFMDTVFVSWLTLSEVNIHVHKDKRGNVFGYSGLPAGCRIPAGIWGGETDKFEFIGSAGELTTLYPDDVITLRFSRSPLNVDKGISPASSAFVWSQIDDLMAQYQKAFLENGAVPAHITIIRAKSREDYEKKRHSLERGLSGARNKNKTVYIWRQQLDDGSTDDEMEVKTIQGSNSSLAIKELVSVVDDRLNKVYGVSNFILGNDSSAKYDNAEQTMLRFVKDVIYPMLVDFWDKFQHELNRVTGGLGYAITFDMEIPELTDRAKVKAETKNIQVDAVLKLINGGAQASEVLTALDLGKEWLPAANSMVKTAEAAREAAIAMPAYEPLYFDSKKNDQHDHKCLDHDHSDDALYQPVFGANEQLEKKIYNALMDMAEEIAANNPDLSVDDVKAQITSIMVQQGNKGANAGAKRIAALLSGKDPIKAEIVKMIKDNGFQVSSTFESRIANRVDRLVRNFEGYTKQVVASTLIRAEEEALSASEIKKALSEVMPRGRAATIARSETRYAFQTARLDTDQAIADKYGFRVKLVWNTEMDARTCDVCAAMNGTETYLGKSFSDTAVTKDGTIVGWEQSSWNDYGREPNAHVNCRCTFDEVFE